MVGAQTPGRPRRRGPRGTVGADRTRPVGGPAAASARSCRAGATPAEAWARAIGARRSDRCRPSRLLAATSRPAGSRSRVARDGVAPVPHGIRLRLPAVPPRPDDRCGVSAPGRSWRPPGCPTSWARRWPACSNGSPPRSPPTRRPRASAGPRWPARGRPPGCSRGCRCSDCCSARCSAPTPSAAVLSGGLGTTSAVLGVALLLLGRWWTGALLARAGRRVMTAGAASRPVRPDAPRSASRRPCRRLRGRP